MKKLILFFSILSLLLGTAFSQIVVVYSSDDPFSSAAAAIVDQKYGSTYLLDCAESDSLAQVAWFNTLPRDSTGARAFIVCDTSALYTADQFVMTYIDSIQTLFLGDLGSTVVLYYGTINTTKCEVTWDALYAGITPPLIIGFLSEGDVWHDRADASGGTDSTVFKANATGWTDGTRIGDYVVITVGPGMGEGLVIEGLYALVSGDLDTLEVTGKFSTAITSGSDFTIVPSSIYSKWAFRDMYAYYGVLLLLDDIAVNSDGWDDLLNYRNKLNTISLNSGMSVPQKRAYLNTVLLAGQHVFNYLVETN